MVFQCRNCARRLIFDPARQKLVCDRCGSEFKPEEFEVPDKDSLTDKKELPGMQYLRVFSDIKQNAGSMR